MRQVITTLLVLALVASAAGQIFPATCSMNARAVARPAKLAAAPVQHCHPAKPPASSSHSTQCVLTHPCCKVAPAEAQLLLGRWRLVVPATDTAVVPRPFAVADSEGYGDPYILAAEIGARPSVEKLKTDLRI